MASLDKEAIREAGFKLLWLYPTPYLYASLVPFLQDLNCQVVTLPRRETRKIPGKPWKG
jgi:hypothetical protein